MLNFAGVLFDLDGTLLDTAPDLGNALNRVLSYHRLPLCDYEQYRVVASDGAKGLLELGFGDKLAQVNFDHARAMLLDFYQQNICVDTTAFDGVESFLSQLNQHNIPWGIVTNKPQKLTHTLLEYFPVMQQCQAIISGDTFTQRKPHPLPLLHAAKQLNLPTKSTLYVGDALRDIQAAQNAGMPSVIARYGYIHEEEDLSSWNATFEIDHINQLSSL